jgi:hypothetical protein
MTLTDNLEIFRPLTFRASITQKMNPLVSEAHLSVPHIRTYMHSDDYITVLFAGKQCQNINDVNS